jgi:hypothetical protein
VTELAKRLTYPRTREEGDAAMKDAFMNIELWKALYDKHGNKLPSDNFWVDISQLARVDAPKAKEVEDMIRNAYLDDITKIPPSVLSGEQKSFMQPDTENKDGDGKKSMMGATASEESEQEKIPSNIEKLQFGNITIQLPKDDLIESWNKAKKMVDIYLGTNNDQTK